MLENVAVQDPFVASSLVSTILQPEYFISCMVYEFYSIITMKTLNVENNFIDKTTLDVDLNFPWEIIISDCFLYHLFFFFL